MTRSIKHRPDGRLPQSSHKNSSTKKRGFFNSITRYWFVWIPAILFNAVLTIDHVVAKHNEEVFRVTINSDLLANQQDDDRLSQSLRSHWVSINDEGNLKGRISAIEPNQSAAIPIEQLDVTLLQDGEKIKTGVTDENGEFVLNEMEPGSYTLVAAGANGFLAYGVNVLPRLEAFDILEPQTSLEEKRAFYVATFGVEPEMVQEDLQIDAAAVPPQFSVLESITQRYMSAAAAMSVAPDGDDAKSVEKATGIRGGFQFPLDEDGNLNGRIQPIKTEEGGLSTISDMNIFLIQDDLEVAQVAVEESGKFKIEDVEPGVYSIVAAGEDGFAALSMELIASSSGDLFGANEDANNKNHYVSHRKVSQGGVEVLGIVTGAKKDTLAVFQEALRAAELARQAQANQFQEPFVQDQQPFLADQGFSGGFTPNIGGAPNFAPPGFGAPAPPAAPSFASAPTGPSGLGLGGGRRLSRRALAAIIAATAVAIAVGNDNPRPVDPIGQSPNQANLQEPNAGF